MIKNLLTSIKNVRAVLAVVTLAVIMNLILADHFELFPAVLIGYLVAAVFMFSTATRLASTIGLTREQAKRRMIVGLILKLLMLMIILFVALKISELIFFSLATGFLTFYLVAHLGLIITSYKNAYHKNDDVDEK